MTLTFNGLPVEAVQWNGQELITVQFNGQEVFYNPPTLYSGTITTGHFNNFYDFYGFNDGTAYGYPTAFGSINPQPVVASTATLHQIVWVDNVIYHTVMLVLSGDRRNFFSKIHVAELELSLAENYSNEYDSDTNQTTIVWYPEGEFPAIKQSGIAVPFHIFP